MSLFRNIWQCAFSPRLYKIYDSSWKNYEPKSLERWGDQVVFFFAAMWSISIYVSPLAVIFIYRRGMPYADVCLMSKLAVGAGAVLLASFMARGCSRAVNPTYIKFVQTLEKARARQSAETKQELGKYDFEFWAWPVDYKVSFKGNREQEKITLQKLSPFNCENGGNNAFTQLGIKAISYITAHTVALALTYPGSVRLLNWAMRNMLQQGRVDLINQGAERFKLATLDDNEIDTIFLNQRQRNTNGNTLVITCEGNCGFYEAGIISTPIMKGYSVLGWNHPGFGCSTGAPYPSQEENAIDAVMRFAIDVLKFPEENIILYGWSIGSYTSTWAAMNYPSIKSLILDAVFDDILPLAYARMPTALEGIVHCTIRNYINLDIAAQLNKFDGRVLIIRRTDDEMICAPTNTLANNRGNNLVAKLLARRYPHLFDTADASVILTRFLAASTQHAKNSIMDEVRLSPARCLEIISKDLKRNGNVTYPSTLGQECDTDTKLQLLLFLTTMYMEDQNSQHCTPLAGEYFHLGWDPASSSREM